MKIVSVSMVKNECDVIESFVRYHTKYFDLLIILDNGSTDETVNILSELERELPIYVIYDNRVTFSQDEITTKLIFLAKERFGADIIVPIDCDEFIFSETNSVRMELEKNADKIKYVSWVTYVPKPSDDISEPNPIVRIKNRRARELEVVSKVIIPAVCVSDDFKIKQGNHDILSNFVNDFNKIKSLTLFYAHYPIRSSNQALSKYLIGWLANLARNNGVLFDWLPFFKKSKRSILNGFDAETLENMALNYNVANNNNNYGTIYDPLEYKEKINYELNLTFHDCNEPIRNIINYAELLAKNYAWLLSGRTDLSSEISSTLNKIKPYIAIKGWLSPIEAVSIYNTVTNYEKDEVFIVEIGSWQGKSAYIMAQAMKDSGKTGKIFCIDPFNGDGDFFSKSIYSKDINNHSLFDVFLENMRKNNVMEYIEPIVGYSGEIAKNFFKKIDILFIDGNHEYLSVKEDYKSWSVKLLKGGYLMFHDVGSDINPGPRAVVNECVVNNLNWSPYKLYDELFITRKLEN